MDDHTIEASSVSTKSLLYVLGNVTRMSCYTSMSYLLSCLLNMIVSQVGFFLIFLFLLLFFFVLVELLVLKHTDQVY